MWNSKKKDSFRVCSLLLRISPKEAIYEEQVQKLLGEIAKFGDYVTETMDICFQTLRAFR